MAPSSIKYNCQAESVLELELMKQKQAIIHDSSPTNRDRGSKQKVKFDVVTPSVRDSIPTTDKTEQVGPNTSKVPAEKKGDLMNETLRHRLAEDDDQSNNPNHSETDPTRAISAFRMKSPAQFIEVNDHINKNHRVITSNDKDNSSDDEYIKQPYQYVNSVGSPIQGDRDQEGEGQNVLISPNSPSQLKIMTSPSNKEIQTVDVGQTTTKEEHLHLPPSPLHLPLGNHFGARHFKNRQPYKTKMIQYSQLINTINIHHLETNAPASENLNLRVLKKELTNPR